MPKPPPSSEPRRQRRRARPSSAAEGAAALAKFDAPPEPTLPESPALPWGYGRDDVHAMVVDPERLFLYWEVTDPAIEDAERHLAEPAVPGLTLRLYDATGRLFDGTNAHSTRDLWVARDDRQLFVEVGRPGSSWWAEIGVRSASGRFVRIARSRRADFPPRRPIAREPEFLTVHRTTVASGAPGLDIRPWSPSPQVRAGSGEDHATPPAAGRRTAIGHGDGGFVDAGLAGLQPSRLVEASGDSPGGASERHQGPSRSTVSSAEPYREPSPARATR